MGLPCGVECVESAPGPLRRWSLFFNSLSEAISFDFASILGGLGRPKWMSKSIFEMFFGNVFFERGLASISGRFLEARKLRNH